MTTEAPDRSEAIPGKQGPEVPPVASTRRSVLQGLTVGAATLAVAGAGAASYRVFDTQALDPGAGSAYEAWAHWKDPGPLGIVGAGLLAANAHNAQAWRFHIASSSIDIFADISRGTGTVDGLHREMYVGLGCALENLVLAAQARGYQTQLSVLPSADPTHVGRLLFVPAATPVVPALYAHLGDRHSNRGPYQRRAMPADVLSALAGESKGLDGASVRWLSTPPEVAAMSTLMIDAARAVTEDEQQSRDAFAWFRSSAEAIARHKDGLTLDGQGLSPMMTALGKLLPASSRTAGDSFWLDQTRTVHTRTAAAYGVITVSNVASPAQRLTGGRLLQRIHLAVTGRGLALQHMNQITERVDREAILGRTPTFAPRLAALVGSANGQALVCFRIGYPVRTPRRSPRRPVAQVQR